MSDLPTRFYWRELLGTCGNEENQSLHFVILFVFVLLLIFVKII